MKVPQSNQRGIETPQPNVEDEDSQSLNRTSVGLKREERSHPPGRVLQPQSNQRGIETACNGDIAK